MNPYDKVKELVKAIKESKEAKEYLALKEELYTDISNKEMIKDFREKQWVQDGIFGDIYQDDLKVNQIVNTAENRLRIPSWNNYKKSAPCEAYCPIGIPTQKRINLLKQGKIKEACDMIFEYTPFPATVCAEVCPQLCMNDCSRKRVDEHINISSLGLMSRDVKFDKFLNIG